MRVKIGPYKNWFGPYQFADLLQYVGVSEDTCYKIGERIPAWPFLFIEKIKPKRTVKVHVDKYDIWSADHTLAAVIGPVLRAMIGKKQGVPGNMLPDEYNVLVSSKEFWKEDTDGPLHRKANMMLDEASEKWESLLEHMAWSFEEYNKDDWDEQYWSGELGDWKVEETSEIAVDPVTEKKETVSRSLNFGNRTCDWDARQKHWEKMHDGIKLFGEHFPSLWT
jgi:hypothetical protein